MKTDNVYEMLLADLGKLNPPGATAKYLGQLIEAAIAEIERMGIILEPDETGSSYTAADAQTIEMYAAYLYRRRADADNGMPRMLDFRLKNRLMHQKGRQ